MIRLCTPTSLLALCLTLGCAGKDAADDSAPADDTGANLPDADGDGFSGTEDCDDADPAVNPDAAERCDGLDNDCDGEIDGPDAVDALVYFIDQDADGIGGDPMRGCERPSDAVDLGGDGDDTNPAVPIVVGVGGRPNGAGTLQDPLDSIDSAVALGQPHVYVLPGTYEEDVFFGGAGMELRSAMGPAQTAIHGTGTAPVVSIFAPPTEIIAIQGFSISGGEGVIEYGVFYTTPDDDPTCTRQSCTNFTYTFLGSGLLVNSGALVLTQSIVHGNGARAEVETTERDTGTELIRDIIDSRGGGLFVRTEATVTNTIFRSNFAVYGDAAAVDNGGTLTFTNVTSSDGLGSIYVSSSATMTLLNSVLAGDEGPVVDGESGATLDATYSDVYGGAGGAYGSAFVDPTGADGNIAADPMFVSWTDDGDDTNDDLHPAPGSPLIDAGNPAVSGNDTDGSRNDMGAYGGPNGDW